MVVLSDKSTIFDYEKFQFRSIFIWTEIFPTLENFFTWEYEKRGVISHCHGWKRNRFQGTIFHLICPFYWLSYQPPEGAVTSKLWNFYKKIVRNLIQRLYEKAYMTLNKSFYTFLIHLQQQKRFSKSFLIRSLWFWSFWRFTLPEDFLEGSNKNGDS